MCGRKQESHGPVTSCSAQLHTREGTLPWTCPRTRAAMGRLYLSARAAVLSYPHTRSGREATRSFVL